MKSYTDLEQSKKLAEFLPHESADMFYVYDRHLDKLYGDTPYVIGYKALNENVDIPCWSLAALLCVLPFPVLYMEMLGGAVLWSCECHFMESNEIIKTEHCKSPIDACYNLIISIHKQNIL